MGLLETFGGLLGKTIVGSDDKNSPYSNAVTNYQGFDPLVGTAGSSQSLAMGQAMQGLLGSSQLQTPTVVAQSTPKSSTSTQNPMLFCPGILIGN